MICYCLTIGQVLLQSYLPHNQMYLPQTFIREIQIVLAPGMWAMLEPRQSIRLCICHYRRGGGLLRRLRTTLRNYIYLFQSSLSIYSGGFRGWPKQR